MPDLFGNPDPEPKTKPPKVELTPQQRLESNFRRFCNMVGIGEQTAPTTEATVARIVRVSAVYSNTCKNSECKKELFFCRTRRGGICPFDIDSACHWDTCKRPEQFKKNKYGD